MFKLYRLVKFYMVKKPDTGLNKLNNELAYISGKIGFASSSKCSFVPHNLPRRANMKMNFFRTLPLARMIIKYRPNLIDVISRTSQRPKHNFNFPSLYWLFSIPVGLSIFNTTNQDIEEKEDEVTKMIKLAVISIQKEDLPKAEQLLHLALKSAQEVNNVNAVTYIYDIMANLAMQRNECLKAENLFKDVLQRFLNKGLAVDDNAIVEVSLKLAAIYANLGQYEKANEGFCFCIETEEQKLKTIGEENLDKDSLLLWAMCQDWYARFLLSLGKYDRAKFHFLRAFEVCNKVMGPEDSQTAILLNDLGSVNSLLKNYDEAIEYLQRAIEIGKKIDSEDLCSFYINLGSVYLQKGFSKEAEKFCNAGLKIAVQNKNTEAISEGASCIDIIKGLQTA